MPVTVANLAVARRLAATALLAAILTGCGGGGGASGEPERSGSPTATVTAFASAPVSTPASAGPLATDPPSSGVPGGDVPPDALLAAEGGDPVLGQLGSYTWLETGSDAPWLPGAPIAVGAGEPLSVRFEPDGEVVEWRARYVPAGRTDPQGAQSLGEGTGAPAFPAPRAGSWTVEVIVDFGANVGSASYFWRLDVQ